MALSKNNDEIIQEIFIQATPGIVFAYLTERDKLTQWFAPQADIDPVPGGDFRLRVDDQIRIEGTYQEIIPDERVVFTWGGAMGLAPGASRVEISLTAKKGGTMVRLRHYGIADPKAAAGFNHGWQARALPFLQQVAQSQTPLSECCFT
ncbi:MAG: SRPBCC domain-containing protein [Pseudomonadota bacterium]